jgi:EAL domain-containing protein (putative c-di-GMP-specific phosphodiesterase class I)
MAANSAAQSGKASNKEKNAPKPKSYKLFFSAYITPLLIGLTMAAVSNFVALELVFELLNSNRINYDQFYQFSGRLLISGGVVVWLVFMVAFSARNVEKRRAIEVTSEKNKITYFNSESKLPNAQWLDSVISFGVDPIDNKRIEIGCIEISVILWWEKFTLYLSPGQQQFILKDVIGNIHNTENSDETLGYLGAGIVFKLKQDKAESRRVSDFYSEWETADISVGVATTSVDLQRSQNSFQLVSLAKAFSRNVEAGIGYIENLGLLTTSEVSAMPSVWRAILEDEVFFVYQPIFCLSNGRLDSFEMLARFKDSDGEIITMNSEVAALIEDSPISLKFHKTLFKNLLHFQLSLKERSLAKRICVNIPAPIIVRDSFMKIIFEEIENGLDLSFVNFELTERTLPTKSLAVKKGLYELTGLGAQIHLDDFGAGQSSIETLSDYDFSVVKLDRVFVNNTDWTIETAKSLITYLHSKNTKILIEGVDDVELASLFADAGAELVQGFIFGKPMSFDDALEFGY